MKSRRKFCRLMLSLPITLAACERVPAGQRALIGAILPLVELPFLGATSDPQLVPSGPCLINFWATWCFPCRAEMPSLNRLYREYFARHLKVFAVSVDEDVHLVREFLMKLPQDFPILLDPGAQLANQVFAVTRFPTTLLVDRSNRIRDVWVGERDWDAPANRISIEALIEG